jgi:hypothetical protein
MKRVGLLTAYVSAVWEFKSVVRVSLTFLEFSQHCFVWYVMSTLDKHQDFGVKSCLYLQGRSQESPYSATLKKETWCFSETLTYLQECTRSYS